MTGQMRVTFDSWRRAGSVYTQAAAAAPATLSSVVGATTDPAACGAAGGLATIDGAVTVMLQVFGEIMEGTVATSLRDGLSAEAQALVDTGAALEAMEAENAEAAAGAGDVL